MNCFTTSFPFHRCRRPRSQLARAIPLAPVAAADPCVTRFDIERAVPVRCDRASDAGHPLVALFAHACDTLSRPEDIIDHTVDDRPPRPGTVGQ
jgi:hypothetical protein